MPHGAQRRARIDKVREPMLPAELVNHPKNPALLFLQSAERIAGIWSRRHVFPHSHPRQIRTTKPETLPIRQSNSARLNGLACSLFPREDVLDPFTHVRTLFLKYITIIQVPVKHLLANGR